jgi:hypothetical protein
MEIILFSLHFTNKLANLGSARNNVHVIVRISRHLFLYTKMMF